MLKAKARVKGLRPNIRSTCPLLRSRLSLLVARFAVYSLTKLSPRSRSGQVITVFAGQKITLLHPLQIFRFQIRLQKSKSGYK